MLTGGKMFQPNRLPVRRRTADSSVMWLLISFAITILITRLYLELSGYPKVGNATLHVAHMLWGGLLMFIGGLLPLVLSNRWAYRASAILNGIGMGLFIDEVGKFITENNDYFYPAAAPIIYVFFLLTVLVYLQIRRLQPRDARAELYRALDDIKEVLDHDLDPEEHGRLLSALQQVGDNTPDPNLSALARALRAFATAKSLRLASGDPTLVQRIFYRVLHLLDTHTSQRTLKIVLTLGLTAFGGFAIFQFISLIGVMAHGYNSYEYVIVSGKEQYLVTNPIWVFIETLLSAGVGLLAFVAAGLLTFGKERHAITICTLTLIVSLTVVNVLAFYFSQFYAVFGTLTQFGLLMVSFTYRRKYLRSYS